MVGGVGGNGDEGGQEPQSLEGETRPQRGGEAETTRFGMEEGDNTDIPATGSPSSDQDEEDKA
jgi:hypothetical protein